MLLAPSEEAAIASEGGCAVLLLLIDSQGGMAIGYRQPARRGLRESCLAGVRDPGHRCATAVAPAIGRQKCKAEGIADSLEWQARRGQAELLALIETHASRQACEQREEKLCEALRLLSARIPARRDAIDIVIAEAPAEPAGAVQHRRFLDRAADHR